ncbi:PDZ domain-containing protein [Aestuariivirga litoralis]|uniref:PDZ domain-containing protein n=1 Tax=Aestuariivirga litoralis TaxID=2650924 RepID=UPI0018C7366E|nr:PDZ domain-containing protein [Aestuariivirga litoralis]MBG1233072.1 PDZ domain-containing protein [Aestuariivirga litoralis]
MKIFVALLTLICIALTLNLSSAEAGSCIALSVGNTSKGIIGGFARAESCAAAKTSALTQCRYLERASCEIISTHEDGCGYVTSYYTRNGSNFWVEAETPNLSIGKALSKGAINYKVPVGACSSQYPQAVSEEGEDDDEEAFRQDEEAAKQMHLPGLTSKSPVPSQNEGSVASEDQMALEDDPTPDVPPSNSKKIFNDRISDNANEPAPFARADDSENSLTDLSQDAAPASTYKKIYSDRISASTGQTSPESAMEDAFANSVTSMGITFADITDQLRARYSIDSHVSAPVVIKVASGSEAEKKGIKAGDVILGTTDENTSDSLSLGLAIRKYEARGQASTLLRISPLGQRNNISFQILQNGTR